MRDRFKRCGGKEVELVSGLGVVLVGGLELGGGEVGGSFRCGAVIFLAGFKKTECDGAVRVEFFKW